ncbi:MAG: hypothetical protein WC523_04765 [Patescibacteria group bacterium]
MKNKKSFSMKFVPLYSIAVYTEDYDFDISHQGQSVQEVINDMAKSLTNHHVNIKDNSLSLSLVICGGKLLGKIKNKNVSLDASNFYFKSIEVLNASGLRKAIQKSEYYKYIPVDKKDVKKQKIDEISHRKETLINELKELDKEIREIENT